MYFVLESRLMRYYYNIYFPSPHFLLIMLQLKRNGN